MERDLWTRDDLARILDALEHAQDALPASFYLRGYLDAIRLVRLATGIEPPKPLVLLEVRRA